jgi:sulfhydrogenase subunit gamma (sulfur reductase)
MTSIYEPLLTTVTELVDETVDTRTLRLEFSDPALREGFDFKAGQFGEYSVFGAGESTFCIASSPTREGYIECSFKAAGKVTNALREINVGDTVGFRGPYGNWFPVDDWKGKNVVFVAGGIGLAPVRCVIWNVLDRRDEFGDVTIVYGARSVGDLVYKRELDDWAARADVNMVTTVDPGGQTKDWTGQVGFVPSIVEQTAPAAKDSVAVVCGPPIMIKFSLPVLEKLGFAGDQIFTTLENRMKCGLGKCGRCNIGKVYVCKDGPVFTAAQLKELPDEF